MHGLRAKLPILALVLVIAPAVLALSLGAVGARDSVASPAEVSLAASPPPARAVRAALPAGVSPMLPPVFDPQGVNDQPGAWLWSWSDGRWSFVPAQPWPQGGVAQPTTNPPARPQEVAVFWVASTDTPNIYWVWNVYKFAISDTGYSAWLPEWQLVTGMELLGQ